MARARSVPSHLFEEPDFFERSSDTQIILIGLVLGADDAGRGLAHVGLLARKLNKEVAVIQTALHELVEVGLLVCYRVERKDYYSLPHWHEWQTLSKPTPSKLPAPPHEVTNALPAVPGEPRGTQENPGDSEASPLEGEEEGEGEKEEEEKGEGASSKVIVFPAASTGTTTSTQGCESNLPNPPAHGQQPSLLTQVAASLKLPVTPELARVVTDYQADPLIASLLGEADAAREYIDDRQRNTTGKTMTPAFFRRWLKREHEDAQKRKQAPAGRATGTTGAEPFPRAAPRYQDLSKLTEQLSHTLDGTSRTLQKGQRP